MVELNNKFLERMNKLLGEEYPKFLSSLEQESEKSIFVNNNKISVQDFKKVVDFAIEPIEYEKCGFYVDKEKKGRHPLHHAGAFYMQEPSAMFTVNSMTFKGDERVLDMCASPGGKTIQIANRIPQGVLVSNEYVKSRSEILYSNVERMGLRNVIITNEQPKNLSKAYGNCFDVCLVDAPCSGEGMFRRGQEVANEWHENINEMCAERQLEILEHANICLKKGGHLIYSTCTYSLEENEQVVRRFMAMHNYTLVEIQAKFSRGIDMPEAVRLYPHKVKGEGQFVALLIKNEENDNCSSKQEKLKQNKIAEKFVNDNTNLEISAYDYKTYAYYCPAIDLVRKDINYVSIGVRLGVVEPGRFEPHHYLFSAFGKYFNQRLNFHLTDKEVSKFLKGETLDVELDDGFGTFCVEDCALSGFKISKGKFKNYYPKGLRNFK